MRATIRCWHLHDQGAGTAPPTRPDHLDSGKEAIEPHIDVITLAVGDLDRALAFYRDGLGLETPGVTGNQFVGDEANAAGAVVMFHLRGGLVLALYPRSELAKDADIPFGPPKTGELSIGHLAPGPSRPSKRDKMIEHTGQKLYPAIEFEHGSWYREGRKTWRRRSAMAS